MNGKHDDSTPRDIIVVGAGPTGLLLAGDLAAAGVPVTLVEKREHRISNLSRAFVAHARTLGHVGDEHPSRVGDHRPRRVAHVDVLGLSLRPEHVRAEPLPSLVERDDVS